MGKKKNYKERYVVNIELWSWISKKHKLWEMV